MKYLTKEEIMASEAVKDRLANFSGPAVKFGFSIEVFDRYKKKYFPGRDVKVLDCGVASGGFIKNLNDAGYHDLFGVDIDNYLSPDAAKLLKEFKVSDLSFNKIDWPDNFFDILTGWCLVPHLENPHNFIREAYRVTRRDGLLIISMINIISRPNRRYFLKHGDFPGYHVRNNHISLLTPAIFQKTILRYFDLVGTEYFIHPRVFTGIKGAIRRIIYGIAGKFRPFRTWLSARWGPKIIYVLKKKEVVG